MWGIKNFRQLKVTSFLSFIFTEVSMGLVPQSHVTTLGIDTYRIANLLLAMFMSSYSESITLSID